MKKSGWLLVVLVMLLVFNAQAAKVDTISTYSTVMKKTIKAVVVTPDSYSKSNKYPVFYLLHGYSGNYANWVQSADVVKAADLYNMIIVSADGGFSSWYWDSPIDSSMRYETYISKELVSWIDERYATIQSPKGRAIAGLSMGGQGALFLGIRHQDVFGAAGSTSGGVDIRPFPKNWHMNKRLGEYAEHAAYWEAFAIPNMLHLLSTGNLKILIDCGTGDFFFPVNEALHEQLLLRNIKHDYIVKPGGHDWNYWQSSIRYQLLFMNEFFNSK